MTRDEIMSMDAAQLRLAIIKAKDLRLADGIPCDHVGCLHHVTHPCEGCGRVAGRYPDWPASISAAWELVEEIVDREYELEVRHSVGILGYECTIETPAHQRPKVDYICVHGDTAPLAICRAYLLYKNSA